MLKKILIVATALVALMSAPAAAQYGDVLSATVSNTNPQPGEDVTIEGTCQAADTVEVALEGESLGTIPVADDDTFSGSVTIPSDLDPGTYTLTASCGGEVLGIEITVGGTTVTTGGATPLPRTGSSGTSLLLKVGGGLILAGAAFALVATKRRTATA